MKRLLLHIGTPKAGSTTLQRFLTDQAEGLAERGILYPELKDEPVTHTKKDIALVKALKKAFVDLENRLSKATACIDLLPLETHQDLDESLSADQTPDLKKHGALTGLLKGTVSEERRRTIIADLDTIFGDGEADTVILSAEALQGLDEGLSAPEFFAGIASKYGFTVEAVVFVRPQHFYINSTYTQRIKLLRIGKKFDLHLKKSLTDPRLNFAYQFRQWFDHAAFGFTAIPFAEDEIGSDVPEAFLRHTGLLERTADLVRESRSEVANPSPGPYTIEVFRRLAKNKLIIAHRAERVDVKREVLTFTSRLGWNNTPFLGLDSDRVERIRSVFNESNDAFAKRFWGRSWGDVFATEYEQPFERNEFNLKATPQDVREITKSIVSTVVGAYKSNERTFWKRQKRKSLNLLRALRFKSLF